MASQFGWVCGCCGDSRGGLTSAKDAAESAIGHVDSQHPEGAEQVRRDRDAGAYEPGGFGYVTYSVPGPTVVEDADDE